MPITPGPARGLRDSRRVQAAEWWLALLLTGIALALHLLLARHAGALWRDEVNSLDLARSRSLGEMWDWLEFESFPILWLLVLRGWSGLGLAATDGGVRVLGLLVGLATLGALWRASRSLGRSIPLLSMALLALNPEVIRWGDSARAWGLGLIILLLALDRVWKATESPTARNVALAALAAVLAVQCLFHNAIALAAVIAGSAAVALRRRAWRQALLMMGAGAVAAASLVPYLPAIGRARTWNVLLQGPLAPGLLAARLGDVLGASGSWMVGIWVVAVALALGAGIAAQLRNPRQELPPGERDRALFCAAVATASLVVYPLFLWHLGYPPQSWYFFPGIALVAVCSETLLSLAARGATVRVVRAVLLCSAAVLGVPGGIAALRERQTNLDQVAQRLATDAQEGDLIVVNPWYLGITFQRYYRGRAEWRTVPPVEPLTLHRYDVVKRRMLDPEAMAPVLVAADRALRRGRAVWVVGELPVPDGSGPAPWLPPPPLPQTGWNVGPYAAAWSRQLGTLLAVRASTALQVPVDRSAQGLERPSLWRLESRPGRGR